MTSRAFHVYPGSMVSSVTDTSAVIVGTGVMSLGLTVAEAREISQQLAHAADDVEAQLSRREHVSTRSRSWSSDEADRVGKSEFGPL